jgi:hypothetical protein
MKKLFILIFIFIAGCSTNRVQFQPQLAGNQTVTYARGSSKLNSQSLLNPEVMILEYSSDQIVIGLSVTNTTTQSILFSKNNLTVELISPDETYKGVIYSYEELVEEAADRGYKTTAQVGNTAVGIGAGFIPFGSIVYSVGRLFYSIGSQGTESHQERVDKLTFSKLNKNYLRLQTIEPGGQYSGIVKIGFETDLEAGDIVVFSLSVKDEIEKFKYICEEGLKEK